MEPETNNLQANTAQPLVSLLEDSRPRPLISIAPMLDITNVYFRYLMRLITTQATLYTEMIHHNTILMNPKGYREFLRYNEGDHPIVVQFGGSQPKLMGECAKMAVEMGYDEINLNVGCPSPKVQSNMFGACLMKKPELVAELMKAMTSSVSIPCTVKCRLGVDNLDSYDFCKQFIETVSVNGKVQHFIIHARKAFLKGLNPSENRNVPPLKYDYVYQMQKDFPNLRFTLNGGVRTIEQAISLIKDKNLEGCMIGRGAYDDPWQMRHIDSLVYGKPSKNYSKEQILYLYSDFVQKIDQQGPGVSFPVKARPISNIMSGVKNNAKYRHFLSRTTELSRLDFSQVIHEAVKVIKEHCKGECERRKYQI